MPPSNRSGAPLKTNSSSTRSSPTAKKLAEPSSKPLKLFITASGPTALSVINPLWTSKTKTTNNRAPLHYPGTSTFRGEAQGKLILELPPFVGSTSGTKSQNENDCVENVRATILCQR